MTATVAVAAPVAAAVIWFILRSPLARRVQAAPSADRWHTQATPLFGGVGIFAGFLAGVGTAVAFGVLELRVELVGVLAGCAIVFLVGLWDDVRSLPPVVKLAAQGAAAAAVIASGVTVQIVGNDLVAHAIAVLWLVGLTNAFNLLDNMDGLAASLAAIACTWFAVAAATVEPDITVLVLSLALGFACAGFLPFNLRPGRPAAIFMGDGGSQVLGFALASLSLYGSYKVAGTTVATLVLPILVLAVPIMDTALVTVVRLLEGRPVHQGGRDHASHRLVYYGLTERHAVVLLAVVATALGATSMAYNVLDNGLVTLAGILLTFAALVQFASFLADVDRRPASAPHGLVATLLSHRRRLVEVAVDGALICAAFLGAYLLRVEDAGTDVQKHVFFQVLPAVLATRYLALMLFGLYRGIWKYAGMRDASSVIAAVAVSAVAAYAIVSLISPTGWEQFPREIFAIDALACIVLIGGSRFAERALASAVSGYRRRSGGRTLIVGAGQSGRSLLRELREARDTRVVGFIDDDPDLRRRRIQGVPVLGGIDDIDDAAAATRADTVLVTIPDAPRERLDALVRSCGARDLTCRFVRRELDLDPRVVLGAVAE
jgi:UDP-GlcNAc:undecaprenyl-phosphate GlcNAc-1-phosphate transferase